MAEEVGGTRTFRGLEGGGDTTATEASLLAQASGTKAGMMLQVLNEQPLRRLGKLFIKLNEQNLSTPKEIRVLGDEMAQQLLLMGGREEAAGAFVTVSPNELVAYGTEDLDITIDVASKDPDTRLVKQRRLTERFTAMAN